MKSVRYFQPYSTKENVVTNAVLLFLSHVYRLAPGLFEDFITTFVEGEISIGPIFGNQEVKLGGKSVVDAVIRQTSFDLNIETKLGDGFNAQKIRNHLKGIAAEKSTGSHILLGINRTPLSQKTLSNFRTAALELGITFAATTFDDIAGFFEARSDVFRTGLNEIIEEFRTFISEQNLVPITENRMLINPCGTSNYLNARHSIYHDQPGRSKVICKYLGCYWDKAVRLIGEVESVFLGKFEDGKIKVTECLELSWLGKAVIPSEEALFRVGSLVVQTGYYDLESEEVRYYVVKKFHPSKYVKKSPYGIQGHRYFDLDGENGVCPSAFKNKTAELTDIIDALNKETWI